MDDAKPKRPLDADGEADENAELVGMTFSEAKYTSLNASLDATDHPSVGRVPLSVGEGGRLPLRLGAVRQPNA
jgi:hypothetical protein